MFRDGKIRKKRQIPFQGPHLLRTTTAFRSAATEGIAATAAQGEPSPCPLGVQGDRRARSHPKAKDLPAGRSFALGSLVQGGLEPPDALDRQDLGVASVLSRTDGQGADLAGCGIAEMTILSLARYTLQPSARRVESVYRWMSFCGYCF